MNEPLNDKELRNALLAVADGEADAAQRERAFAAMAELPELARFVFDQQRLRSAVKRSMGSIPEAPASLRARVEAQLKGGTVPSTAVPSPANPTPRAVTSVVMSPPRARLAPWFPAAIAALLCMAAGVLFFASRREPGSVHQPPPVQGVSRIVSTDELDSFAGRHVSCSRLIAALHDSTKFPTEVKDLPKAIGDYLGRSPYGVLDLSALGFKFDGAGPCSIPGSRSVHLIFRPIDRDHRDDALSLWVQPDNGSRQIAPDKFYQASGENAVHPIVLWKHAGMVYYLVGDEAGTVTQAAQKLASRL
jgi:hypothetical protein